MHDINVKTILSQKNGMNLYRGCTHGCIYCDSRSEVYGMDHPLEDVAVKANSLELLEDALKRKRKPCIIGTGSMCDPYMQCEKSLLLTRKSLELIYKNGFGVTVITKSDLILRDLDLYEKINEKTKVVAQITLTTYDDDLCGIIEPNVCPTSARFKVLKEFQKRGIPTVVWLCPVLPFINDTAENLNGILDYCLDAGVAGIINFGFGVTLRKGNREYFYKNLDKSFPGIKKKYIERFGNSYECTSDNSDKLCNIFYSRLKGTGVYCSPKQVFEFLNEFPEKTEQLSFF